jgi:hypothetical protein
VVDAGGGMSAFEIVKFLHILLALIGHGLRDPAAI